MSDFNSLPPEVQAQLVAQMQSDPWARATNDFGQGSGFLSAPKKPTSWARMGDKNDLMSDMFRTTQSYLKDYIPDLYPEVEDPGMFTGYRSDLVDLYRNNPAYREIDLAMQDGASFDEAVRAVAASPDFAAHLPTNDSGRPDLGGFRSSAEKYVSERAREGREFDQFDAERRAYEDYVNPRNEWADRGNDQIDIQSLLRNQNARQGLTGAGGRIAEGFGRAADLVRGAGPGAPVTDSRRPSVLATSNTRMGMPIGEPVMTRPSPTRNAARGRAATPTAAKPAPRTAADRNQTNKAYNDSVKAVYDFQKNKQSQNTKQSKKQENLAKTVRAYNLLMYGE
jgi:hypothetical protein